jgi:predicted AlkP superfamily phosphohydrolase/phosphomutase
MARDESTQVVYIGFDACDADLMEQLAASGRCPSFARLLDEGAVVPTVAPYGTFVGSSWMTISTGRNVPRHGYWNWVEVDPVTYEPLDTTPRSATGVPFWKQVAAAGRKVAAFDVPHMEALALPGGITVKEWGCHDRHDGTAANPSTLLDELDQLVGRHPVGCRSHPDGHEAFAPCDYTLRETTVRSPDELQQLADLLSAGVDAKIAANAHLFDRGPWDLFISVMGEGHCAGHQFWHVHDPEHPRHDPADRRMLGDPVTDTYEGLDRALGDLLARVDPDTTVYVQLNHGMRSHFDGDHLFDELLLRIDNALDGRFRPGGPSQLAGRLMKAAPAKARPALQQLMAAGVRLQARRGLPEPARPTGPGPDRRWYQVAGNTSVGAVRFNLAGRESQGKVAPGREYEQMCHELERALLDVIDIDTGRPLVRRVVPAAEVYDRTPDDRLPDLFVEWNRDKLIERVWSPLVGTVVAPYANWRTGDHHDRGVMIARGPGIAPGRRTTPMTLMDVAPTVAAAVGVELHDVDGVARRDLLPVGIATRANGPSRSSDVEELHRLLGEMHQRVQVTEREHAVWTTMAWLAQEPSCDDVLVSVITPTYQRPAALAEAIQSVLAQRHQRWEMLIVDDGSDTARKVVESFDDKRLRVFDAEHGGACAARNVALDEVRGELVTYLDDDNLLDPGWLHAVVWAFREHPGDSVLYGARIIDDSLRVIGAGHGGWPWMQFNPFDRHELEQHNFADMGVIAHRATVAARFDPTLVECGDWDFLLALTEDTVPLELPAIAAYYRTGGDDRLTGQQPADAERVRQKWAERRRSRH